MIAAASELAMSGMAKLYAIALQQASDQAIGLANLSAGSEDPSLGLGLSRAHWGHSYGREAVAATRRNRYLKSLSRVSAKSAIEDTVV